MLIFMGLLNSVAIIEHTLAITQISMGLGVYNLAFYMQVYIQDK